MANESSIDEGHDFEPDWYKLIVQMIDPQSNSLLVLYDDAQNIYGRNERRKFTRKSLGVQAQGRTTILKLNYRIRWRLFAMTRATDRLLMLHYEDSMFTSRLHRSVHEVTGQLSGAEGWKRSNQSQSLAV